MASLDKLVQGIAESRSALYGLPYDDSKYDEIEEKMHNLEDELQDLYGETLVKVLQQVHQKHCPRTAVVSPLSYMARVYKPDAQHTYRVDHKEGVEVIAKAFSGKKARLVIVPDPTRILLNVDKKKSLEVWCNEPEEAAP